MFDLEIYLLFHRIDLFEMKWAKWRIFNLNPRNGMNLDPKCVPFNVFDDCVFAKKKHSNSDWYTIKSISKLNFDEIAYICDSSELAINCLFSNWQHLLWLMFVEGFFCSVFNCLPQSQLKANLSSDRPFCKCYAKQTRKKNAKWNPFSEKHMKSSAFSNSKCPSTALSHAIGGLFVKFYETLYRMSIHSSARMSVHEMYTASCFVMAAVFK